MVVRRTTYKAPQNDIFSKGTGYMNCASPTTISHF